MKATDLNLDVLAEVFRWHSTVENRLRPDQAPHIRRCIEAGLAEVISRKEIRLTSAGAEALHDRIWS